MKLLKVVHSSILSLILLTALSAFRVGNDQFSDQGLYDYILECKIAYPRIVYAQAVLETGHFHSGLFIADHNLFGFRGKDGYLHYTSWKEAVDSYALWQEANYRGGDYNAFLVNVHYAEDSGYVNKLKRIHIPF